MTPRDESFPVLSALPCVFVQVPANMQLSFCLDPMQKQNYFTQNHPDISIQSRNCTVTCTDQITAETRGYLPCEALSCLRLTRGLWCSFFFFFWPKFIKALGLFSHYQKRQVSSETGRLVDTVIVKLLPPLICLPLWCLPLSRPITLRRGLSGSSSSNLMKGSQLLLLLSARLQHSQKQRKLLQSCVLVFKNSQNFVRSGQKFFCVQHAVFASCFYSSTKLINIKIQLKVRINVALYASESTREVEALRFFVL